MFTDSATSATPIASISDSLSGCNSCRLLRAVETMACETYNEWFHWDCGKYAVAIDLFFCNTCEVADPKKQMAKKMKLK